MARLGDVEEQMREIEGFVVRVRKARDGRDVRSDLTGLVDYPYVKAAPNTWTIQEWYDKRFMRYYGPDHSVDVQSKAGRRFTHWGTVLRTVRRDP